VVHVVNAPVHLIGGERYAVHIDYRATRPLTGLQPGTLLLQWRTPATATLPVPPYSSRSQRPR
jgi:beta-glucosidase